MEQIKTTKAIRFKLESSDNNSLINDSLNNLNSRKEFNLNDFVKNLDKFIASCNKFLFLSKKKEW